MCRRRSIKKLILRNDHSMIQTSLDKDEGLVNMLQKAQKSIGYTQEEEEKEQKELSDEISKIDNNINTYNKSIESMLEGID